MFMETLEELAMDSMVDTFTPVFIGDRDFTVSFTKANSDEVRTMRCNFFKPGDTKTFDEVFLHTTNLENKDLVTVYDLDADKWKSFYQSRVVTWGLTR